MSFDLGVLGVGLTILAGARLLHDFGDEHEFIAALQPSGVNRGQFELAGYYSGRANVDIGLSAKSDVGGGDASLIISPVINYFW